MKNVMETKMLSIEFHLNLLYTQTHFELGKTVNDNNVLRFISIWHISSTHNSRYLVSDTTSRCNCSSLIAIHYECKRIVFGCMRSHEYNMQNNLFIAVHANCEFSDMRHKCRFVQILHSGCNFAVALNIPISHVRSFRRKKMKRVV